MDGCSNERKTCAFCKKDGHHVRDCKLEGAAKARKEHYMATQNANKSDNSKTDDKSGKTSQSKDSTNRIAAEEDENSDEANVVGAENRKDYWIVDFEIKDHIEFPSYEAKYSITSASAHQTTTAYTKPEFAQKVLPKPKILIIPQLPSAFLLILSTTWLSWVVWLASLHQDQNLD